MPTKKADESSSRKKTKRSSSAKSGAQKKTMKVRSVPKNVSAEGRGRQGRKPKFDYEADEFYEEILALALQGLTDAEISYSLSEKFGQTLNPDVFGAMKNGYYQGWNEADNKRRSERIQRVLARGRHKTVSILRGRYIKAALGGIKTKSKSVVTRKVVMEDKETEAEVIQTTETEMELPPNVQALANLLYHYDTDWREVQQSAPSKEDVADEDANEVNVTIVYNSKEDLELQNHKAEE